MTVSSKQTAVSSKKQGRNAVTRAILVCLLLTVLLPTGSLEAQQAKKVPRIGYLSPGFPRSSPSALFGVNVEAFRQGLRELGYVEGKNIIIEYRYAEQKFERFPELAAELVRSKVDVIRPGGGPASLKAAVNATATIPIVMVTTSGDPVKEGLINSLARPGGNITGLTQTAELGGKRLELLKETIPKLSRVAILWDANVGPYDLAKGRFEDAAGALNLRLLPFGVRGPNDLDVALKGIIKERAGALHMGATPLFSAGNQGSRVAEFATNSRLPTISQWRDFVETSGGLMTYGPDLLDMHRRAATYVDKILKGAKPADLPVEQPTKFELIINLKTAKQIGLTIPPNVLARADRVIR